MTRARDLAKLIAGSSTLGGTGELVLKDVDTADGSSPKITFQTGDTDIAADDVLGTIDFQAPDEGTGTDALLVAAGIEAVSEGDFSASSNATRLSFKTGASETATEKMTIKSDGNVGIGESSPDTNFHINATDIGNFTEAMRISNTGGGADEGNYIQWEVANTSGYGARIGGRREGTGGVGLHFFTGQINGAPTEKMRIDHDGNFLVGRTTSSSSNAGFKVEAEGDTYITAEGAQGRALYLNRLTSDGNILELAKDDATIITIKNSGSAGILILNQSASSGVGIFGSTNNGGCILPANNTTAEDNQKDLGRGDVRWDDIHATNGTIQPSDENEKQDIASLTSAEITAATAISKLFKTYKWKDKVAAKGDNARTHTGVVAQQVQSAMSDAGLDVTKYAFWCSNTWGEKGVEAAAVEANEEKLIKAQDAYTRTDTYHTKDEAPEGATERTRLGIRYPELLAFIGAATEQRLTSIESRLTALEAE